MLAFLFWGYFCHNGVDRKSQIVKNMINENGCTRLDEILGQPHLRLTEAKKDGAITAKETVLLNNLV